MAAALHLHVGPLHRPWAERLVAEVLRPEPRAQCVDMPCGDGALSMALARAGGRVMALDDDARAVEACAEMARALGRGGVDVQALDGPDEAPRGVAQICGSLFTLPHRAEPAAWLEAAIATLRPGGRVGVAVWGGPGGVPPLDHLLAALSAVSGVRPPALDAALSLGAPGACEGLADSVGVPGIRVERLRDVIRFEGVEHLLAAVSSAYDLGHVLDALGDAEMPALLAALSERLLPYAARDGTLIVPVEAAVLVYAVTEVV